MIGHALHNDLSVLQMQEFVPPELRRDTSRCLRLRELAGLANQPVASLRALTLAILGLSYVLSPGTHWRQVEFDTVKFVVESRLLPKPATIRQQS